MRAFSEGQSFMLAFLLIFFLVHTPSSLPCACELLGLDAWVASPGLRIKSAKMGHRVGVGCGGVVAVLFFG